MVPLRALNFEIFVSKSLFQVNTQLLTEDTTAIGTRRYRKFVGAIMYHFVGVRQEVNICFIEAISGIKTPLWRDQFSFSPH